MNAPIFVVGANRSGTTLIRLLLNAHSNIAVPDELTYFGHSIGGVPISQWRTPSHDQSAYAAFVDDFLQTNCAPLAKDLDLDDVRTTILSVAPNLRVPYQTVLEAWARHHGKDRWGEKTPGNLFYADYVLEMFPDAQFIYVVRDPRAGVASMQNVTFFPDDVVFNALSRRKHWKAGHRYLNSSVPDTQQITVRYEDLVRDPKMTVQRLCEFIDEPFEPGMLSFHEDADRYMKDEAASNYNEAATKPISTDRIHGGTHRLTSTEIAIVESICAPEMKEFGYEPAHARLDWRSILEIGTKRLYWLVQCWRNPHRHFTVKSPIFARSRQRLGLL